MNDDEPPFYLVWCEDGGEPRKKHKHIGSAEAEAERLARNNPGKSFCVMTCVARFTERRVSVERFNPLASEIPF